MGCGRYTYGADEGGPVVSKENLITSEGAEPYVVDTQHEEQDSLWTERLLALPSLRGLHDGVSGPVVGAGNHSAPQGAAGAESRNPALQSWFHSRSTQTYWNQKLLWGRAVGRACTVGPGRSWLVLQLHHDLLCGLRYPLHLSGPRLPHLWGRFIPVVRRR